MYSHEYINSDNFCETKSLLVYYLIAVAKIKSDEKKIEGEGEKEELSMKATCRDIISRCSFLLLCVKPGLSGKVTCCEKYSFCKHMGYK